VHPLPLHGNAPEFSVVFLQAQLTPPMASVHRGRIQDSLF
jgi:hypothetical protein